MVVKKTVLFVPGGFENLGSRGYKSVFDAIKSQGYKAEFVEIKWQRTTINDWVAEFEVTYTKYNSKEVILAGFSWGAMIAFVAAAKRAPSELWLFSLSPYFSDDSGIIESRRAKIPRYLGKYRLNTFKALDFTKIASNITCPTIIFVGNKEVPDLQRRCKIAAKEIPTAKLVVIPNTKHKVDDPNYISAIKVNI